MSESGSERTNGERPDIRAMARNWHEKSSAKGEAGIEDDEEECEESPEEDQAVVFDGGDARPLIGLNALRRDMLRVVAALGETTTEEVRGVLAGQTGRSVDNDRATQAMQSLVKRGLVMREAQEDDGRAYRYALTDHGRDRLAAHRRWFTQDILEGHHE